VNNFVHRQHEAEEVACIDCHLSRPDGPQADTAAGEAMTAHSFTAEAVGCSHCHAPLENMP
jgi:formate-dependent nitrite reductase cytochrome c552 subunit